MAFFDNKALSIICTAIVLAISGYLAYLAYVGSQGSFSFDVSCVSGGLYGPGCTSSLGTKLAAIFIIAGLAINYIWAKYRGY